jgi:histidinol dehydrogenase
VARQLEGLSRADIIITVAGRAGGIVLTADLAEAAELADAFAPEHLCLATAEPRALADTIRERRRPVPGRAQLRGAGRLRGRAEPRHAHRAARRASPRRSMCLTSSITSLIELDAPTAGALAPTAARLARAEALTAHAAAAERRAGRHERRPLAAR